MMASKIPISVMTNALVNFRYFKRLRSKYFYLFFIFIICVLLAVYQSFLKSPPSIEIKYDFGATYDPRSRNQLNFNRIEYFSHASLFPSGAHQIFNSANVSIKNASCELRYEPPVGVRFIDTNLEYSKINFNPSYKYYWNSTFERRYEAFQSNSQKPPLKVIIIPHSHNDPGWLKTFEAYFLTATANILNNMVEKLDIYRDFAFIWSEISYLARWWRSLESMPDVRVKFREQLERRQLELVTGGWVMTDEATAHYYSMIDQLIEGHQWIRTNFGLKRFPLNGWSIDPFGHSVTMPYLLEKSGIKKIYIQRIHYGWRTRLAEISALEFWWKQAFHVANSVDRSLLTHIAPFDLYSIKHTCGPEPDVCLQFDFRRIVGEYSESRAVKITEQNMHERAALLLGQYGRTASLYSHNVALIPLGDDFRYDQRLEWDQQHDNFGKLIDYINSNPLKFNRTEIKFGTLGDYFDEIEARRKADMTLDPPFLTGDFMPYGDVYAGGKPSYWTGYYTTRPFWKQIARHLQAYQRSAEILYTLARFTAIQKGHHRWALRLSNDYISLCTARQNLDLFQHHDAITGTSTENVMQDYGRRLHRAMVNAMTIAGHALQYLVSAEHSENSGLAFVAQLFATSQLVSWDQQLTLVPIDIPTREARKLVLFNSHLTRVRHVVKLRSRFARLRMIRKADSAEIAVQVNPVWNSSLNIETGIFELIFTVDLPPLSLVSYELIREERKNISHSTVTFYANDVEIRDDIERHIFSFKNSRTEDFKLESGRLVATFDRLSGHLIAIKDRVTGIERRIQLSFHFYRSAEFYSGAYLFQPYPNEPLANVSGRFPVIRLIEGELNTELIVSMSNSLEIIYRVYHDENVDLASSIEMEIKLDMSEKPEFLNQEIIVRMHSDIDNFDQKIASHVFYTDSNGFQMVRRVFVKKIGIDGNYYPMTSAAYIEDSKSRFSVLASHSHGVTSPGVGMLELMIDRRIRNDDNRGLNEPLLDNKPISSRFLLMLESICGNFREAKGDYVPNLSSEVHHLSESFLNPPIVYADDGVDERPVDPLLNFITDESCSKDLSLVNLRTMPSSGEFEVASMSALLILHNHGSNNCKVGTCVVEKCTKNVTSVLFRNIGIESVQETSLTGIYKIGDGIDLGAINVPPFEITSFNLTFTAKK